MGALHDYWLSIGEAELCDMQDLSQRSTACPYGTILRHYQEVPLVHIEANDQCQYWHRESRGEPNVGIETAIGREAEPNGDEQVPPSVWRSACPRQAVQ